MSKQPGGREISIDIFRAVTMLLMIFVNDLWSLNHIPVWLEHASADEDFMGLADVVFPCFLVIVGMSIPYAAEKRVAAGDGSMKMIWHIIIRTISLLVMGVYIVNIDNYNQEATGFSRQLYQLLMVIGIFLIWNIYPRETGNKRFVYKGFQVFGILLLLFLAYRFRGDDGAGGTIVMTVQWWGMLGLIGWAYGTCAIIYLFLFKKRIWLLAAWLFFVIVNILSHAGWLATFIPSFWGNSLILGDGAFHAFTMSGILATLIIKQMNPARRRIIVMTSIGAAFVLTGLFLNNYFIISKIKATPPWVFICTGISYIMYALIFYIADVRGRQQWFAAIKIAGTNTLTCYLVPYFVYSLVVFSGWSLPDYLLSGATGILKSLVFSFSIICFTALLNGLKIRLKL